VTEGEQASSWAIACVNALPLILFFLALCERVYGSVSVCLCMREQYSICD
jgi:hypothetical protein